MLDAAGIRPVLVLAWLPVLARAQLLLLALTTPYARAGGMGLIARVYSIPATAGSMPVTRRTSRSWVRNRPTADLDWGGVERQDSALSRQDGRLRPETQAKINGQLPG